MNSRRRALNSENLVLLLTRFLRGWFSATAEVRYVSENGVVRKFIGSQNQSKEVKMGTEPRRTQIDTDQRKTGSHKKAREGTKSKSKINRGRIMTSECLDGVCWRRLLQWAHGTRLIFSFGGICVGGNSCSASARDSRRHYL